MPSVPTPSAPWLFELAQAVSSPSSESIPSHAGLSPSLGLPHISQDPQRQYIEYDPYMQLGNGKTIPGRHGLISLRAEIGRAAYDSGMLDNPFVRELLKIKFGV